MTTKNSNSRIANSTRNTLFGAIMYATKILLQFVVRAFFNRYFITEYLGLNGLYGNILNVLSLAELGVGNAIVYSMYKPIVENDTEKIKSLVRLYRNLYMIIGVAITVIGLALIPALPYLIKDVPEVDINLNIIYVLYLAQTVIGYFFAYRRALIFAYQRNDIESKVTFIVQVLLSLTQIGIIVWGNYYAYVIAMVGFNALDAVLIFIISYKMFPQIRGKARKLEKADVKEITKNTGAMVFHKLGSAVVFSTDSIIISSFVGLGILGIYSNYTLITTALGTALNLFISALKGSVGNLIASSDNKERVYFIFNSVNLIYLWVVGFFFIGVMICAQDFMTVLTGDNERKLSYLSLFLIIASFYLTQSRQMVNSFKECAGLFWNDRLKPIFESVLNLGLDILLVYFLGLNGVIIATIISTVALPLWIEPYVLFKNYFNKKLYLYFVRYITNLLVTAVAFGATFGICYFIPHGGIGWLILRFVICLIIPNLVYLLFFFRTKEFGYLCNTIKSLFKKKTDRIES